MSAKWSTAGANAGVPEGSPERGNGYAVALNWTALTPGPNRRRTVGHRPRSGLVGLPRREQSLSEAPALTLVYADAGGNIGAQVAGRIRLLPPAQR